MTSMLQIARSASNTTAALLKISGLNLLLPQGEVRTLESATDVDTAAPAPNSVGWAVYAQQRWPVYCLSDDLALLASIPSERRAYVLLVTEAGYLAVMCDDMLMLKNFAAQVYELPLSMRLPDTPILSLVLYEQGIACVSNAKTLTAYVEQLALSV
jgi:hypothetical protein